ncbi:MAG TPA: protein phosphatase CheZ, partial [Nitrospirota bacterium]
MGPNAKRKEDFIDDRGADAEMGELVELTEAMAHGDFYKDISGQLQGELGRLAEFINMIKGGMINVHVQAKYTAEQIPQASLELSGINDVTLDATNRVLELTERVQDREVAIVKVIAALKEDMPVGGSELIAELEKNLAGNKEDLMSIIATMSFQDMTGQKIRKIIKVVDEVQTRLLEILLSVGA